MGNCHESDISKNRALKVIVIANKLKKNNFQLLGLVVTVGVAYRVYKLENGQ